jgi:hypothetical protein
MRGPNPASALLVAAFVLTISASAQAASITWSWSNAGTGTERGTFITSGDLVGASAPAGTYVVRDFSVTASGVGLPLGAVSDGTYTIVQPLVGFVWDGAAPTQFFRSSGGFTNGFGFDRTGPGGSPFTSDIIFAVGFFDVESDGGSLLLETQTVNLDPIPEPATMALAGLAGLAVALRRRCGARERTG